MPADAFMNMTNIAYMAQAQNAIQVGLHVPLHVRTCPALPIPSIDFYGLYIGGFQRWHVWRADCCNAGREQQPVHAGPAHPPTGMHMLPLCVC